MSSVNKVIIVGNLGKDPEARHTQSGSKVVSFSVATSEKWKDKNSGQLNEKTEWHNVTVFGNQADSCERFLSKGRKVYVEGKLQTDKWTDKNGNDRYTTKIVAQSVVFLSSQDSQQPTGKPQGFPQAKSQGFAKSFNDDDIPF